MCKSKNFLLFESAQTYHFWLILGGIAVVSTSPQTPDLHSHSRGISSANTTYKHTSHEAPTTFVPAVKESLFVKACIASIPDYPAQYEKLVSDAMTLPKTKLHKLYPAEYNSLRSRRQQAKERHIKFADSLKDFRDWLIHLGPKPVESYSVDRIKSAKGYVPNNIRWDSKIVQTINRKVTKWHQLPDGSRLTTMQLSKRLNLSYHTLYTRLNNGWTIERLFEDELPTLEAWRFPPELAQYCQPLYNQRSHFNTPRIDWFIHHFEGLYWDEFVSNRADLPGFDLKRLKQHLDQAKQEKENILIAIDRYEEKKRAELIAIFTPASQETTPPAPSITPPPVVFGGRLPDNTGMHPLAPADTSIDTIGKPNEDTPTKPKLTPKVKALLEKFNNLAQGITPPAPADTSTDTLGEPSDDIPPKTIPKYVQDVLDEVAKLAQGTK